MEQGKERGVTSYVFDMIAFCIALGLAYFLKWKTSDLVWSLWLSSLVIGYLTILTIIFGRIYKDIGKGGALAKVIPSGLFQMFFFFFHFGVFHLVHAMFLKGFFPLEAGNSQFEVAPDASVGGIGAILIETTSRYGIFLVPAIIAQRLDLLKPFRKEASVESSKDSFAAPYKNVIKMHMLIIFFCACSFFKLEHFLVYAAVYTVYFFPLWSLVKRREELKSKK